MSDKDASALPPGDPDNDAAEGLEPAKPSGESYDDSLEAILLQAGARPPEPAASKLLGSKTLMGLGIEGLNLASIRAAAESRNDKSESKGAAGVQADEATRQTGTNQSDDKEVTSLLDEVAQALNVQATEYRDRARGRLPGMPSASSSASPERGAGQAAFASGRGEDVEFEDPDDAPTGLTPGIISVVDEHDEAEAANGASMDAEAQAQSDDEADDDDAVVLAPSQAAGSGKSKDARTISRPVAVPPVPGLTLGTAPPAIGPPPGLSARPPTPAAGLPPISGRVRLPTPAPGLPIPPLPSPAVGRMTLPLGIAIPPISPASGTDLTATSPSTPIALESSRRASGSGRVSTRRPARTTEQVVPISSLPGVLTAHVKLATVSLAGLIAVTFAGGLFVGMLVWKGQGRGEHAANAGTLPSPTAATSTGTNAAPPTGATATTTGAAPANGAPAIPPVAGLPTEVVVTPLAPGAGSTEAPLVAPKPVRRVAAGPRARRPPPIPTVADTAALFPKTAAAKPAARPAGGAPPTASKPMATNAAQKPAAKSKTKSTWHDPFAD